MIHYTIKIVKNDLGKIFRAKTKFLKTTFINYKGACVGRYHEEFADRIVKAEKDLAREGAKWQAEARFRDESRTQRFQDFYI